MDIESVVLTQALVTSSVISLSTVPAWSVLDLSSA